MSTEHEFDDWSFNDLKEYFAGKLLLAIGRGDFQAELHLIMTLTMRWKEAQEKKEAKLKR